MSYGEETKAWQKGYGAQGGLGNTVLLLYRKYSMKIPSPLSIVNLARTVKRQLKLVFREYFPVIFPRVRRQTLLPLTYTYRASPDNLITYTFQHSGNELSYSLFKIGRAH